MPAMNVVRFKVKPGREKQFLDHHRSSSRAGFAGFQGGSILQTGEQTFCLVGQWKDMQSLVDARPQMIRLLDGMRDLLEDLGGGTGVTDPVSGTVVLKLPAARAAKTAAKAKKATKAKKAPKRTAAPMRKAKKKAAKRSR